MRKALLLLICLLFASDYADAQIRRKRIRRNYLSRIQRIGEFSYTASAGISSYYGDLKQAYALTARPTIGASVNYRFAKQFNVRGELLWYRITGADTLNDITNPIHPRNLSFRADNFEANVALVAYLYNKYDRRKKPIINPYAFAGLGLTTNNPKAFYKGEWHNLRPLETEGVSYSSVLLSVPFGLGVTYHDAFPNFDISLETGYRYTFSDYLDDVSTNYRDPASFSSPLARELADRRDEFIIKRGISKQEATSPEYPGPYEFYWGQNYRGNPSNNDWYLISTVKVTYTPGLPQRRRFRRAKY